MSKKGWTNRSTRLSPAETECLYYLNVFWRVHGHAPTHTELQQMCGHRMRVYTTQLLRGLKRKGAAYDANPTGRHTEITPGPKPTKRKRRP